MFACQKFCVWERSVPSSLENRRKKEKEMEEEREEERERL